jgi:hypothetical protein
MSANSLPFKGEVLSYHVALVKGTDVDKPRNLAKSVQSARISACCLALQQYRLLL